ncbi:MAG: 2Fe-2S iron-sulfur cluster-binding protein [Planctomycetes bacterium]|jgi:NADH dehydrogenase/NADH:ubiquinone oxidoreductase subunit G|nr:2Fe-2S iron-sulfur cluster-binding protein [Planctomycetota bacterium]
MIAMDIDGRRVVTEEGRTLLDAAREAGIDIPTLCHHEALEPFGGCRLCVVEAAPADSRGPAELVISCLAPARDGLVVRTASERVKEARRTVLDLLLARCPTSDVIRRLAAEHGVPRTSFPESTDGSKCILCMLCERVCAKIGAHAIGGAGKSRGKRIAAPFDLAAEDCIGCLACARICPTGHIGYEETDDERKIWGRTFRMVKCEVTGRPLMTEEQRSFEAKRAGLPEDWFTKCPESKRRETAETIAKAFEEVR